MFFISEEIFSTSSKLCKLIGKEFIFLIDRAFVFIDLISFLDDKNASI